MKAMTVRLDYDLYKYLRDLSCEYDISIASVVRALLLSHPNLDGFLKERYENEKL